MQPGACARRVWETSSKQHWFPQRGGPGKVGEFKGARAGIQAKKQPCEQRPWELADFSGGALGFPQVVGERQAPNLPGLIDPG